MEMIVFSWDDRKNERNKEKHAISFEEAQTVFFDDNAVEFYDPTILIIREPKTDF